MAKTRPKPVFKFDERSLASVSDLKDQGHFAMSDSRNGYVSAQEILDDIDPEFAGSFRRFSALRDLVDAAVDALSHTEELREAWRTGAIRECDGKGGTRSNRNVDVEVKLRKALDAIGIERRERLV